jgi:Suppressor of fused protein (SUFU)
MLRLLRNLFAPAPSPEVIGERERRYESYFGAPPKVYHSKNKVFPHIDVYHFFAEYPAQYQTFFDAFHTVPIGSRLTDTAEISAFLLAPAELEDLSRLSFSVEAEPVDYLVLVPITMTEHAFAREVGSEELHQLLKDSGLIIHGDDERRSIVDYTPKEIE